MKKLLYLQVAQVVLFTTACATLNSGDGAVYRDSAVANPNPAPKALTPPDYTAQTDATPVMDEAHSTSQADYHFTMGETLSYEGQTARAIEEFKTTLVYDSKSVPVHMRLAEEYVRMGMMTEAVEQAETSVQMAPQNIAAHMLLGGLYSGLKMFEPASVQFGEVLKLDPTHTEAAVYLGALMAEDKKYDESIKYFETLTKNHKFKEPEKAYYYIGRVKAEQGDEHYAEAEKAFTKALSLRPEYPEAAMALALLYRGEHKDAAMETLLKTYQEKFGPDHEMARLLSHIYLEKEDYDKALDQLQVVDSFERDNVNVKIQIALILIEQKKFEQAATRLEDVLQQAPDSDKVRFYLGAVYEEVHRTDLAVLNYSKIPAASTYFPEAVVRAAHLTKVGGNLAKAIEMVEGAIKKQDDIPQLYAFYATLLDEAKSYKSAVKMLTSAVERFPTNTQLRFFLGTMYDRVGNSDETIEQMNKVLSQDKDHVQALNYLAYTYAELGRNLDAALELAQHALKLQPNDGYILDTIGWVHFKKGEIEQAIRFLEAAHAARADESIIAEHLGDAYLRHQMWQKAQKLYQKAAELEHDDDHGRKILEKLANVNSQIQQTGTRRPASAD